MQALQHEKISQMIHNFASKGKELFSEIRYFLDVVTDVQSKTPELFKTQTVTCCWRILRPI